MKTNFYTIECLTDLHMGNESNNFSVIDKTVERDAVTELPVMKASGVKGALREYAERKQCSKDTITKLFGSEAGLKEGSKPGSLRILAGRLLARPVRASQGKKACYLTTCPTALEELVYMQHALLGTKGPDVPESLGTPPCCSDQSLCPLGVEDVDVYTGLPQGCEALAELVRKLLGGQEFVVLPDDVFKNIPLPVSARNYLDNGISKNLWYEEDVPGRSVFWFVIQVPEGDAAALDDLLPAGTIVQFGGEASIGKGICRVTKVV